MRYLCLLSVCVFIWSLAGAVQFAAQAYVSGDGAGASNMGNSKSPACDFKPIDLDKYGKKDLAPLEEIRSENGRLELHLAVTYTDPNKVRIAGCGVKLRSYNGKLAGPTMRVKPGDVLLVTLDNQLPDVTHPHPQDPPPSGHASHFSFNTTNLHTHGLHVSPAGNSDNVLIEIRPNSTFQYEIRIPDDHPPGTFWYHAHVHGSTAVQISSGMVGAIVVEGLNDSSLQYQRFDTVAEIGAASEQVLLLQQITYGQSGQLEDFDQAFGPGKWRDSRRHVLVNGQLAPIIKMTPGEVQRWRFIHAGVRENIRLRLEEHDLHEIAVDGLALGRIARWPKTGGMALLGPGYRTDVLVKANPLPEGSTSFDYVLFDEEIEPEETLRGSEIALLSALRDGNANLAPQKLLEQAPKGRQIVAIVRVEGEAQNMQLPQSAALTGYEPHKPVEAEELNGTPQNVTLHIGNFVCGEDGVCCDISSPDGCAPQNMCTPGSEGCAMRFMVDGKVLMPHHPTRKMVLGTAAEWTLTSFFEAHPFHIHVNPFQVNRVEADNVSRPVWKDTVFTQPGRELKLRMRYKRYVGRFVLHCHILDHEDEGMMQIVEIVN